MAAAYVLVSTRPGEAPTIRRSVQAMPGVVVAEETQGPYDLILRVDVQHTDELAPLVDDGICGLSGVLQVLPCPSSDYVRTAVEEHFAVSSGV